MFRGTYTALVTPFRNGEVDQSALARLVEFQLAGGVTGLVIGGTTGEAATMSQSERETTLGYVAERVDGRAQVIAGTGTNDTAETIRRTRRAREHGANAALVVAPYYNKPTQNGLYEHFGAVAADGDLPIMLYNVPGRTAVNVLPETVIRLSALPNVVAIKEASGSLDQSSEIIRGAHSGFAVLSGDDSLTLPIMSIGGRGVVSVVANIVPAAMASLTAAMLADEINAARALHLDLVELCRAMFLDNNPTAVKAAMAMLDLCGDEVRLPLTTLSAGSSEALARVLQSSRHLTGVTSEVAA